MKYCILLIVISVIPLILDFSFMVAGALCTAFLTIETRGRDLE
jgi:hypothetical protein